MISKLKSKIPNLKSSQGFSLVELLAVLGVIVVVGSIASAIIISSLRTSSKANVINSVRQNGNFALLQISRTVQYAKSFDGVSTDGTTFTNDCTSSGTTNYRAIRVVLFDETKTTFSCKLSQTPPTITSLNSGTTTELVDTITVSVSQCYFLCSQKYKTEAPAIGIFLTLSPNNGSSFPEKQSLIPFNTSVTMRNPNK